MPSPGNFIHIEAMGIQATKDMLIRGMTATSRMKPALELVSMDMMKDVEINFTSQGRRGGGSWKPLADSTLERRARAGVTSDLILIVTSALKDSMTVRGDPEQDLRISQSEIRLKSNLPYARVQNEGGGHIPARPFATFVEGDVRRWVKICERYLSDAMKKR
jgi:phage gpG-like protein